MHPLTFTDTCWTFKETEQLMWAQHGALQQWKLQQWVTSTAAGIFECDMQALVYCWRKCTATGGSYAKIVFCNWEFATSDSITVLFVVISMEINRQHYFWSNLCSFSWLGDLNFSLALHQYLAAEMIWIEYCILTVDVCSMQWKSLGLSLLAGALSLPSHVCF